MCCKIHILKINFKNKTSIYLAQLQKKKISEQILGFVLTPFDSVTWTISTKEPLMEGQESEGSATVENTTNYQWQNTFFDLQVKCYSPRISLQRRLFLHFSEAS